MSGEQTAAWLSEKELKTALVEKSKLLESNIFKMDGEIQRISEVSIAVPSSTYSAARMLRF